MKVLCIKHDTITVSGPDTVPNGSINEGCIYTVVDECEEDGDKYYLLKEQSAAWYWCGLFIPLSSIDETTFQRNYNKETV